MNITLLFITLFFIILGAIVGILEYFRLRSKHEDLHLDNIHKRSGILRFIVILGVLGLVAWLLPFISPGIAWQMPLWLNLYMTEITYGMIGIVFGVFFGLALTAASKEDRRKAISVGVFIAIVLGVIFALQWRNQRLEYLAVPELHDTPWQGEMIMQTTDESCAPAAGANIAGILGVSVSEKEMAKHMGTTTSGTSWAQVIVGMRKIGIEGEKFEMDPAALDQIPLPSMLFVYHQAAGPETHTIAAVARDSTEQTIEIWDPLVGKVNFNREQLTDIWNGRGISFER